MGREWTRSAGRSARWPAGWSARWSAGWSVAWAAPSSTRCLGAFLLAACLTPTVVAAQAAPRMDLTRLTSEVDIDGSPTEAAWDQVEPLPLTMYFPTFRGTPAQRTVIKVAYDDRYLYAVGWFYDEDPSGIRINSLYRDRWNGDDAFAIYVDAFNDNQNAKWFGVNAAAMRFDLLASDDGMVLNGSWDTFWDAETVITDEGWFVEVRVPFSSLGFQVDDQGRAVMGLTVTRLVARTGERVTRFSSCLASLRTEPHASRRRFARVRRRCVCEPPRPGRATIRPPPTSLPARCRRFSVACG